MKVPSFNKGLKSSDGSPAHQQPAFAVGIDYLSFTANAEQSALAWFSKERGSFYGVCLSHGEHEDLWAAAVVSFLFGQYVRIQPERRGFRHFYERHFRLQTDAGECGFIAFGGERQKGTFCVQLTGAGCAHVTGWAELAAKLQSGGCSITRVDVACDDFAGAHPLSKVVELHAAGEFTTNGRPPALGHQGWDDGSGETWYVGKNTGNQQLCVYEKGKQLGDKSSSWVRWEARFGNKYRTIPLDILTAPAAFVRGHYPALTWVAECAQRMVTHVKRAQAEFARALHWCRHQYGATLNLVRSHCHTRDDFARVVETLLRPSLPAWAAKLPHGYFSRSAAVQSLAAAKKEPT